MNSDSLLPFEEARQQMPPEAYREHLQGVHLTDIMLDSVNVTADRRVIADAEAFMLHVERRFNYRPEASAPVTLSLEYLIRGDVGAKQAVHIAVTYSLLLEAEHPLPEAFVSVYANVSADAAVWPYLREFVSSVTNRMGVGKLTLPLLTDPGILNPKEGPTKRRTGRKRKTEA